MPKIKTERAVTYGSQDNDNGRLTFRERLMKRFAAHEWVRVINTDDEKFKWQYLPEHAERFEFTKDPMKNVYRDPVEAYELDPGESEVIIGENAYLMIEGLYKKLISKRVIGRTPDLAPGQARNFNWTDGKAQEDLIDRIYLGKESPTFRMPSALEKRIKKVEAQPTKSERMRQ